MDNQYRVLIVILISTLLVFTGILVWMNVLQQGSYVITNFEKVESQITANNDEVINASIYFQVIITNRGRIEQMEIPCSVPQSHLALTNESDPIDPFNETSIPETSIYYDIDVFSSQCDNNTSTHWISEGEIAEIEVVVDFTFYDGMYTFYWYHSYMKEFGTVTLDLDVIANEITISYS